MIIHVFGKVHGPTSTGYSHDEYCGACMFTAGSLLWLVELIRNTI